MRCQTLHRQLPSLSHISIGKMPFRPAAQTDVWPEVRWQGLGHTHIAAQHRAEQGDIAHAAAESADDVERFRQAFHPGARHQAQARLVADHAAIGGRPDD